MGGRADGVGEIGKITPEITAGNSKKKRADLSIGPFCFCLATVVILEQERNSNYTRVCFDIIRTNDIKFTGVNTSGWLDIKKSINSTKAQI